MSAHDQQGHRDGSPEAVEARERAAWANLMLRRIEARRLERTAADLEQRGLHHAAARFRAVAARIHSAAKDPAA